MRDGEIDQKKTRNNQREFGLILNEIKRGWRKSEVQKSVLRNIRLLYDAQQKITEFYNDYSLMLPEAKQKAKYGRRLKMLTPKQMLQRLRIALAQVKSGNTSENLLDEIHQIIYSSYRTKEITKKVCNSIMNSIKL